jgi:hypothetical protein
LINPSYQDALFFQFEFLQVLLKVLFFCLNNANELVIFNLIFYHYFDFQIC